MSLTRNAIALTVQAITRQRRLGIPLRFCTSACWGRLASAPIHRHGVSKLEHPAGNALPGFLAAGPIGVPARLRRASQGHSHSTNWCSRACPYACVASSTKKTIHLQPGDAQDTPDINVRTGDEHTSPNCKSIDPVSRTHHKCSRPACRLQQSHARPRLRCAPTLRGYASPLLHNTQITSFFRRAPLWAALTRCSSTQAAPRCPHLGNLLHRLARHNSLNQLSSGLASVCWPTPMVRGTLPRARGVLDLPIRTKGASHCLPTERPS